MTIPNLQDLQAKLKHELNPFERFTDLLSGRDDRQDIEIILLYHILETLAGQDAQPGVEFPSGMVINVPLTVERVDIMKEIKALTTDVIKPTVMADCSKALRAFVVIRNNFDQQVSVSVINNDNNSPDGAFTVHTWNIAAAGRDAYGIKNEEWAPFIGVTVTPASSPTAGTVSAQVIIQKQG